MKKIMTKMMTTLCVMGCIATISAPITAHAEITPRDEVGDESVWMQNCETGETTITYLRDFVLDLDSNRACGISEETLQKMKQRYLNAGYPVIDHGVTIYPDDATTETTTVTETASSSETTTSTEAAGATDASITKQTEASSTTKSAEATPVSYTEAEIEAAWEESNRTDATCTEDGVINYTNSLTEETKTEAIPATGHTYTTTSTEDATCTEAGKIVKTCDACGDVQEETIEALGHIEGEPTTKVEPTLFTDGVEVVTCDTCGEELSSTVLPAKLPHPTYWIVGIISLVVLAVVFCVSFIVIKKRKQNSLEE